MTVVFVWQEQHGATERTAVPEGTATSAPIGAPQALGIASAVSSSTGSLFLGKAVRKLPANFLRFGPRGDGLSAGPAPTERILWGTSAQPPPKCVNWCVVTTIAAITDAVERVLELGDAWCTVIVADKKTPTKYFNGKAPPNAVLLTVADQVAAAKTSPYVAKVPWNHFGRKNIGFLYAIQHGAAAIFDFDDDNILYPSKDPNGQSSGNSYPLPSQPKAGKIDEVERNGSDVFNPYPMMGSTNSQAWPRGFPMMQVTDRSSYDLKRRQASVPWERIQMFQSLADEDPDVDAVYRLTQRQLHFFFDASSDPIAVPQGVLTPYNAQASIHLRDAFWGLLLPITVPGRVSDIWRGYFVQVLLWELGFQIAFTAPFVVQKRNVHNYLADMSAEVDLYFKAGALVKFLRGWSSQSPQDLKTLPARMEQLYADLYERQYIELEDLIAVQDWLGALQAIGYRFPKPIISVASRTEEEEEGKVAHDSHG